MSLLLTVDRDAAEPLWKQIVQGIGRLVDGGALPPGERLPASRVLAGQLGLNRSTVCRAYEELWALGYLESRPGSYSTVRGRARAVAAEPGQAGSIVDWTAVASPSTRLACDGVAARPVAARPACAIDFASLTADPDVCPVDAVRRSIKRALLEDGAGLLGYADPAGYPRLREWLARRMRTHGVAASADDILITQGAQQAIDLVLRFLAVPGGAVALESPTYGYLVPLLRLLNLRALAIPMAADGLDLDALEEGLKRDRPLLLYTMPNFHNPTGITTSQAHRERLLAICERHRVPVLEDGFEEEMKYFGRSVLPVKSMDVRGLVIYLGTFSKVIFPGLRIGWVAADRECIRYLTTINRVTCLSGSMLAQATVERFCAAGWYDAYLRRLHRLYRRRMQALLKGLDAHMPPGVEWTKPMGGATLWLRIPRLDCADEERVLQATAGEGVLLAPGSLFFPAAPRELGFRLSISRLKTHEMDNACRQLARGLRRVLP